MADECVEARRAEQSMKTFINDKLGVFIEFEGEISKGRYAIIIVRLSHVVHIVRDSLLISPSFFPD